MKVDKPKNWNCGDCRWFEKVSDTPSTGLCFGVPGRLMVKADSWCGTFTVRKGARSMGKG